MKTPISFLPISACNALRRHDMDMALNELSLQECY
jgi:hypothetical protein